MSGSSKHGALTEMLAGRLTRLEGKHRFRRLRPRTGMDLSSNDYLGLSDHPYIREALARAVASGVPLGAGGSRLLGGNTHWHEALEERLARFKGAESALIFNSGYDANMGVIATLCGSRDVVFCDELNHASLIDGVNQSRATRIDFPHNDLDALEQQLKKAPAGKRRFIVVESLYSMEGDRAPLKGFADLASAYDAQLIVDEAHATGVFGPNGAGLLETAGLSDVPIATIHTCGKALGGFGAFVTCPQVVKDYLINYSRHFIFTTALPPLLMVQLDAVLDVIADEPWRRERVLALAGRLRDGLRGLADLGKADSQIVPVILGSNQAAVRAADLLQGRGYDIRAIRPPTVPGGTARLRIAARANLTDEALGDLISACADCLRTVQ